MEITTKNINGQTVAIVRAWDEKIAGAQAAIDLIMTAKYETGSDRIAVAKEAFEEKFFILSSGLAGEVLQKFINYRAKVAIFGDFSHYTSKPLHDFIYECNNGRDVFFVGTESEAAERLARA